MEKLKELFKKEGYQTELFSKDENGKYSAYKTYLLSLFNGEESSFGNYDEKEEIVYIERCFLDFPEQLKEREKRTIDLIEWGSYYMTDLLDVFSYERERLSQNLLNIMDMYKSQYSKKKEDGIWKSI